MGGTTAFCGGRGKRSPTWLGLLGFVVASRGYREDYPPPAPFESGGSLLTEDRRLVGRVMVRRAGDVCPFVLTASIFCTLLDVRV